MTYSCAPLKYFSTVVHPTVCRQILTAAFDRYPLHAAMYTTELKLAAEHLEISETSPVVLADRWKFVMLM